MFLDKQRSTRSTVAQGRLLNAQRSMSNAVVMRRYSQRQSLSSLSEINITPLLDLAFVLLIIFMITTPLLENSMSLIIPSRGVKNSAATTSQIQTVSIDRNEAIRLNNQPVDLDALSARLAELKRANSDVAVVIR